MFEDAPVIPFQSLEPGQEAQEVVGALMLDVPPDVLLSVAVPLLKPSIEQLLGTLQLSE
jgi:hypothetical protein